MFLFSHYSEHTEIIYTKSIYASANKTHSYDMLCLYFIESFNKKRKKKTQRQIYAKENQSRIICFVFLCIYLLGNFRYLSIVSVYIFLSIWIEMSVLFFLAHSLEFCEKQIAEKQIKPHITILNFRPRLNNRA